MFRAILLVVAVAPVPIAVRAQSSADTAAIRATALDYVEGWYTGDTARNGGGKETPPDQMQKDVVILDIFRNAASVRATMSGWIDYMHLAKWNGRWVIVNVLWELKAPSR